MFGDCCASSSNDTDRQRSSTLTECSVANVEVRHSTASWPLSVGSSRRWSLCSGGEVRVSLASWPASGIDASSATRLAMSVDLSLPRGSENLSICPFLDLVVALPLEQSSPDHLPSTYSTDDTTSRTR